MSHAVVLGDFLRKRRSTVDHASVGLPSYGQRRVPGLRREELALLAGISTSYYTRIEQGGVTAVSASVIDAIARALQLDDDERAHLCRLAGVVPPAASADAAAVLDPSIEQLLRNLDWMPAGVLGRDMCLLAWNRSAHRVFADHLPFEAPRLDPHLNWARLLFTDPRARTRYVDWDSAALDITGRLRTSQAMHPDDRDLASVVRSLQDESDEFSRLWAAHPTREGPLRGTVLDHPELGELRLVDVVLRPTDNDSQLLIVFQPEPGSHTEQVLRRSAGAPLPGVDTARR